MYNEGNERGYFFRNLIVKILLVLLFVFLLMWLFPMPNMEPFYDKIFTQNINSMTEAAKSYYTISRLPVKEGETKTLTLKEMLDNKMLIEFTDSDGKACDVNKSYVEVTKKDGEYVFKTNLACSTGEDYVVEYFGCYDVCSDGSCKEETKDVIEYQFYKVNTKNLVDKYICKDGYTLKNNKCILSTSISEEEKATLKCLSGYTYNKETNKCEKKDVETTNADKICPSGYIYATSMNTCIKLDTNTEKALEKCKNGTAPVNGICTTISTEASLEKCNNETTPVNGVCTTITTENVLEKCSNGTKPENGKCTITRTENQILIREYCAEGVDNGTSCTVTTSSTTPKICGYSNWVCSRSTSSTTMSTSSSSTRTVRYIGRSGSGYVYEVCTREYGCTGGETTTTTTTVAKIKVYGCSDGSAPVNGVCTIITKENSIKYCSNGTAPVNGRCTITTTENAIEYCSNGSAPVNGVCTTTTTEDSIKYCRSGVTPVDGLCTTTNTITTNYTYKCKYGTLSGEKCYITTYDKADPTYECAKGFTKSGTACYKTTTTDSELNATAVYKSVTEKVYKWSRSEKLEGWTRTGQTRTVTEKVTNK